MSPDAAALSAALGARIDQIRAELDDLARQLAVIRSLLCRCDPHRQHDDYTQPADYLHAADCPVTTGQQLPALTQEGTR